MGAGAGAWIHPGVTGVGGVRHWEGPAGHVVGMGGSGGGGLCVARQTDYEARDGMLVSSSGWSGFLILFTGGRRLI
jgi:hypothetical protein